MFINIFVREKVTEMFDVKPVDFRRIVDSEKAIAVSFQVKRTLFDNLRTKQQIAWFQNKRKIVNMIIKFRSISK